MSRLIWIALFLGAAMAFNGFLLYNEEIVPPDAKTQAETRQEDQLFGMRFNAPEREANIGKMGFGPDEIKDILKRINTFEEKYRVKDPAYNQVVVKIEATEDQDALAAAFCGTGATLPVRYAAMAFLVEEKDTKLQAVDLQEISAFQFGDWAKAARIQTAYEEGDRTKDRKEDAVRMVMAAVLARAEGVLIEHASPWGGGFLGGGWTWAGVQSKYPGVKTRVVDYVALMHLVLESANAEGGLCTT
ncbi:MAG: hypothetical protein Q8P41_17715 [Pseudomonadota bacterium]|nr:hypothetical protein [Pseudomonadota bacterium]